MTTLSDLEYTPEEDEAWNLFLRKFGTNPQPALKAEDLKDSEINKDGIFNKSIRPLRKPT